MAARNSITETSGASVTSRSWRAGEAVARHQRNLHLEDRVTGRIGEGARVHRLQQFARPVEGLFGLVQLPLRVRRFIRLVHHAEHRRPVAGLALAVRVQPGDLRDARPLASEVRGLDGKFVGVGFAAQQFAGHAHQLLLVFDQVQANLLLCDLGVTLDRFGLPLDFLVAQVPERRDDRCQEQRRSR
jgi:hypothetical protein